jgi:hypothetical protein
METNKNPHIGKSMKLLITILTFVFINQGVFADYIVTGQIRGFVCEGFFIEACKYKKIDAVDDKNGKLYTVMKKYKSVDEYKKIGNKNVCNIYIKKNHFGFISSFFDKTKKGDNFYTLNNNGKYEKLDVEHLTFDCLRK